MHDIYAKVVEPALFPVVLYALSWVASIYGRRKYGEDGGLIDEARSLVKFYAGWAYLAAWHQEISTAWSRHPNLTALLFILLIPPLFLILMPRRLRVVDRPKTV